MDFAFTDEQQMIAETARSFFAENATSHATRLAMAADGFDRTLWSSFCRELGLAGATVPEAYGGAGLGMVEFAILAEAAGSQVAAIPLLGLAMTTGAILASGSEAQKEAWLPRLLSGDSVGVFAEAPEPIGDGVTLTGCFQLVPHGGVADLLVLGGPEQGWVVEASAPGVAVTRHVTMDQTRPLATVTLQGARGEPLPGWPAARAAANAAGLLCLAAEALGGAQATLDRTVQYSKERIQFGRPIGSFQAYKHRLADMTIQIEQARSAVYWAACAIDEESSEAALATHAAKSFCADTFFRCAGDMIQLHGGIGFTWEHDAHLFFKRGRSIQTLLGDSAWHRERIAAQIFGEAA